VVEGERKKKDEEGRNLCVTNVYDLGGGGRGGPFFFFSHRVSMRALVDEMNGWMDGWM
jgi:hypothetical protein